MLLDVPPNWAEPLQLSIEFATDVFVADDYSELRAAMRDRPRISWRYGTWLKGEARLDLEQALTTAVGAVDAIMPLSFAKLSRLPFSTFSDGAVLDDETRFNGRAWRADRSLAWVAGTRAWFENGPTIDVLEVVDDAARLGADHDGVDLRTWALCRGALAVTPSQVLGDTTRYTIAFSQDPGDSFFLPDGLAETKIDGLEVFPFPLNWREAVAPTFEPMGDVLDFGFGVIARRDRTSNRVRGFTGTVTRGGTNLHDRMILFFVRHRGRRDPFWVPDWSSPMTLIEDVAAGQTFFRVAGSDRRDAYRKRVIFADGSSWVLNGATVSDGVVSYNTPGNLPAMSAGTKVSWLFKARFAADRLETTWQTDRVFEAAVSARLLEVV